MSNVLIKKTQGALIDLRALLSRIEDKARELSLITQVNPKYNDLMIEKDELVNNAVSEIGDLREFFDAVETLEDEFLEILYDAEIEDRPEPEPEVVNVAVSKNKNKRR